jgi:CHAT domain-containing protein
VAASLWSVSDISTAMLMVYFYAGWRKNGKDKLSPAQALRAAQQWLRDTTNKEKAEYFKRYSPRLSGGVRLHEAAVLDFFNEMMSRDLDGRDFAHPFWWAAFYLTGV